MAPPLTFPLYAGLVGLAAAALTATQLFIVMPFRRVFLERQFELPALTRAYLGHPWAIEVLLILAALAVWPLVRERGRWNALAAVISATGIYHAFLVLALALPLMQIVRAGN